MTNIIEIISMVLGSSTVTSIVTFFTTRKRYVTEIEQLETDNFTKVVDRYQQIANDLQELLVHIIQLLIQTFCMTKLIMWNTHYHKIGLLIMSLSYSKGLLLKKLTIYHLFSKGISFEQTDFWQIPEMVFRGFTFEVADRKLMDSLFFAQN